MWTATVNHKHIPDSKWKAATITEDHRMLCSEQVCDRVTGRQKHCKGITAAAVGLINQAFAKGVI